MEPPLTNTQSTKGGSFTGNLWRNWTLIEGRFKSRAAAEFRGSGPAGAQSSVARRPASLSCYNKSPTHAAVAFQTKYISRASRFLSVAHTNTHTHTLQRNIRHTGPHCAVTQVMQEARRMCICIMCSCAPYFSCASLSASLPRPLDVRCCGGFFIPSNMWVFFCRHRWMRERVGIHSDYRLRHSASLSL